MCGWLCQQAADCIHIFMYLYTFHELAVQYLICSNVWSAMSTSSRLCTHIIPSCVWTLHMECQCHSHWKWVTTSLLRPSFKYRTVQELNCFVRTTTDRNHLSDDQWRPPRLRTSDDGSPPKAPSNSHACTPLPSHLYLKLGQATYHIKIKFDK